MSILREEASRGYERTASARRPFAPFAYLWRMAVATAWALRPQRISGVLPTLWLMASHYLWRDPVRGLPDPSTALDDPEGLCGICDVLTPQLVVRAYRSGLFPLSHFGPQKWWALPRRSTLFFENTKIEKSVRRILRNKRMRVTFDEAFEEVIAACAEPRDGRIHITWITPDVIELWTRLHRDGYAHSVEVRDEDGELVGGLYGLALGRVFFTESQFFRKRDASKVGFAVLNHHLQNWGFVINDGKAHTAHLGNTGFFEIDRDEHIALVQHFSGQMNVPGKWRANPLLNTAEWQPEENTGLTEEQIRSACRNNP